ncbi:KTSC domain-containing protein [Levilactobacillus fujinensis]|uniref:KTSC domain-containing protein n=1 Tax=Levilactobacillus fujinensis TaxID=2486024 RepID=A0ABW1TCY3_9LACO|nr:KTSC domain-containing protein [Levilactobacillus fujinensis]
MEIMDLPDNANRQHFQLHYNGPAELLEVRVITGEVYVYRDVTRTTYQHFLDAANPAIFYHNVITHHGVIPIHFNCFQLSDVGRDVAKMLPIKSHVMASIAYDNNQRLLLINLLGKAQLLYPNVPREVVEILLHAPDPDKFYMESILSQYPCCAVK